MVNGLLCLAGIGGGALLTDRYIDENAPRIQRGDPFGDVDHNGFVMGPMVAGLGAFLLGTIVGRGASNSGARAVEHGAALVAGGGLGTMGFSIYDYAQSTHEVLKD